MAHRLIDLGWLKRAERTRAVHVTKLGTKKLRAELGVALEQVRQ